MQVEIKYRTPDENHITVLIGFIEYIIDQNEYTKIITPATKISGSGTDYRNYRNKLLTEYFINGPKEQFSW